MDPTTPKSIVTEPDSGIPEKALGLNNQKSAMSKASVRESGGKGISDVSEAVSPGRSDDHKTRKGMSRDLISAEVNMSQLSSFMNHIIQVVNQHAKLLDTLSHELLSRPKKLEVGEMFNVLSHSLPYEKLLTKYGHTAEHCFPRTV